MGSTVKKKSHEQKEDQERIMWKNKFEFAFNVLGYNVGLGNIWRFSYLCFKDGGGAFLIPYMLTAIIAALPLLFLEISIGQFTRHGCIAAWDLVPVMRGVGIASMAISIYFNVYFVIAMSWCVLYFVRSFTLGPLPWSTCDNFWNSEKCIPIIRWNESVGNLSTQEYNLTGNETGIASTTEFWNRYVLQKTDGIENVGGFSNWKMVGCFVASWIACYLCIFKGIKTSGKAAYVTVILPYVIMLALFVRAVTLEGAGDGVLYYLTPNITKLKDPIVWLDGASQPLFSIGLCYGCLYGLGSYNRPSFDCYKSSYFFVAACCGSSLFFGFVVFSFVGHLAKMQNKDIKDVFDGGPGLVFQLFPAELSLLQGGAVWSALFFASLVFLSIDAVFAAVEGCITALADYWPRYFGTKGTHLWRGGFCLFTMIMGLPLLLDGGIYIFELFNLYATSGISFLWVGFFESFAIGWLYGIDNFFDDVKSMIGYYPPNALKYAIKFLTPALFMVIFFAFCLQYRPIKLGNYVYPWWADMIGWMMCLSVILSIPIFAAIHMIKSPGTIKQRWKRAVTPKIHRKPCEDEETTKEMLPMQAENEATTS